MATQKGRNWSSGDIVTAANLSSIERGVSEVAEEYTPTTWANGNTVTAASLNNIEQGIANAGGGSSSDFSTATVTLVNNAYSNADFYPSFCNIDNHEYTEYVSSFLINSEIGVDIFCDDGMHVSDGGTSQYLFYLLPNKNFSLNGAVINQCTLDGNAEMSYITSGGENFPIILITGDCTITISDSYSGPIEV